ncbi:imidazole glycerol phosphate synthase subunit HisF [Candidatus Nucleicultrix amoebiphila]|jgi:cyclase|uniref:Imidazole glycerol phosphate synthase subunit HisF n=1 Tax=Candidatus Nucleicultrix amoebiphila FS5 TaxID=1414854 RepID=A0A1W6N5B6_9PROT|nr:imidazole glycerol phosphate synthase cyclase subunit [Candidatus Nucleicultrix amoebiphila]ARN85054.1 imidazole glycerol phosphate synthase [Candidatus Nucleicultrix amoebiphila FS5]
MLPRVIARMDIKSKNLIKGVHLEGLRVLGEAKLFAKIYYEQGADEIIYLDSVASLYERSYLVDLIKETANDVFIPLTVGGGIKTPKDVESILRAGADKIAINTAAVKNPSIIKEIATVFGSQCIIVQVDVKRTALGFEVYIDGGREKTGLSALEWIKEAQDLGCGEIILTSIDQDGTKKGFDVELISKVSPLVHVPLIVSSGFGKLKDLSEIKKFNLDALAIGSALHYNLCTISDIKKFYGFDDSDEKN